MCIDTQIFISRWRFFSNVSLLTDLEVSFIAVDNLYLWILNIRYILKNLNQRYMLQDSSVKCQICWDNEKVKLSILIVKYKYLNIERNIIIIIRRCVNSILGFSLFVLGVLKKIDFLLKCSTWPTFNCDNELLKIKSWKFSFSLQKHYKNQWPNASPLDRRLRYEHTNSKVCFCHFHAQHQLWQHAAQVLKSKVLPKVLNTIISNSSDLIN